MDLPVELPDFTGPSGSGLHRGSGGQLSHQAQAIIKRLITVFEHSYREHADLLNLTKQMRLPGFIAFLTGVERSVVSKHVEHLRDGEIRAVHNAGGRKRKSMCSTEPLPSELPVVPSGPPSLEELLVRPNHDLPLRSPFPWLGYFAELELRTFRFLFLCVVYWDLPLSHLRQDHCLLSLYHGFLFMFILRLLLSL